MAKSWLINGQGIARKVKSSSLPLVHQIKDCGVNRECPNCHCRIDNSDVSVEWPGFPAGVKFEPTDVELLEHLAAKCGVGNEKPHQFIDEFIPTLDEDEGICCKHPENLPGASKDGSSIHFFYKTTNAYTTGQRKRRKICKLSSLTKDVRWHKTGKTKAVMKNGIQLGWKKIMVLYGAAVGGSKPSKLNWVMHQYHLGTFEDEKEGQYVVAKISYQPEKHNEKVNKSVVFEESDAWMNLTNPRTPKTDAPDPRRLGKSPSDDVLQSPPPQKCLPSSSNGERKDNVELPYSEDDSQAIDLDSFDVSLFCKENLDAYDHFGSSWLNHGSQCGFNVNADDEAGTSRGATSGVDDLENLDLGTPPDFNLADLQFSSQDSIFGWLGRL